MALTKTNFYVGVVSLAILFFIGLGLVGTSLVNSDRIALDGKSLDYINDIKGQNEVSNMDAVSSTEISSTQSQDVLTGGENNTQVSTGNEFLSTYLSKKERAKQPVDYISLIYNIPSSILIGFGLNVEDFRVYINIFGIIILVSIIFMIIKILVT